MDTHIEFLKYILEVEKQLINQAKPQLERLEKKFGESSEKANILGRVLAVSKDYLLNLVATNDTFFVDKWWKEKNMDWIPEEAKQKFKIEQINHLKYYFFLRMVSTIEAQMRIILRVIYPGVGKPKDSFKRVYDEILSRLGLQSKYEEAFNLARVLRNTIHNIGVHTDTSIDLIFNGKTYSLIEMKVIDFFTYEFNLELLSVLIDSIVEITNTNEFKNNNSFS